jgi:hypothetical protein
MGIHTTVESNRFTSKTIATGALALGVLALSSVATPTFAAPAITSVSGCNDDGTGLTNDCPSEGNIPITVVGSNFGADPGVVRVDGSSCTPTLWSDTSIVCTLPEGTGRSRLLNVEDVSHVTSPPVRALSYEDPVITSVGGCGADGCARGGGGTLTINGSGFGSSGARALVGSEDCDDDSIPDSDTELTCLAPSGSGMKPVRVVTAGAGISSSDAEIAYAACDPGTRASGATCVPCDAGFFSADYDAPSCLPCPTGTASSVSGATSCSMCEAGTFAPYTGATSCQVCTEGSSSATGATACLRRDTMQCWKAKDLKNPAAFAPGDVTVSDELSTNAVVTVKKLGFVCLPSDVSSGGIADADAYQCCYKSSGAKLATPVVGTIDSTIGGQLGFEVSKRDLTCEPCNLGL